MQKLPRPEAPLFDSHSHLNSDSFSGDRGDAVARMIDAGLTGCMVVGCDRGEETLVCELVQEHPGLIWGAWALHPEYENVPEIDVEEIIGICSRPQMLAVGETGLDYHWCKGDLTWQKERFRRHIEAARTLGKPLIIHAREAESDALDILEQTHAADVGFVMHCFGGTLEQARRTIDLGGMVSFTGVLTFRNARSLREIAAALPLERLMVETDCPYMAPVPLRGKRCEPAFVEHVARELARIHDMDYASVAAITTANAKCFFHIPEAT